VDRANGDIEEIALELEKTNAKADEYLEGWQRARAEFSNYKKRIEREQADLYQTITGTIAKQYLDVVDDLALALKSRPGSGEGAEWAHGIELVYRKLMTILENQGITPMKAQGAIFDPTLHEAISSEESEEFESGKIIEVVKQGYMMGERVLRPALVRVAR
jgi:molecular chaperone GrpE